MSLQRSGTVTGDGPSSEHSIHGGQRTVMTKTKPDRSCHHGRLQPPAPIYAQGYDGSRDVGATPMPTRWWGLGGMQQRDTAVKGSFSGRRRALRLPSLPSFPSWRKIFHTGRVAHSSLVESGLRRLSRVLQRSNGRHCEPWSGPLSNVPTPRSKYLFSVEWGLGPILTPITTTGTAPLSRLLFWHTLRIAAAAAVAPWSAWADKTSLPGAYSGAIHQGNLFITRGDLTDMVSVTTEASWFSRGGPELAKETCEPSHGPDYFYSTSAGGTSLRDPQWCHVVSAPRLMTPRAKRRYRNKSTHKVATTKGNLAESTPRSARINFMPLRCGGTDDVDEEWQASVGWHTTHNAESGYCLRVIIQARLCEAPEGSGGRTLAAWGART
ncbi:hypothetical protein V8D89_014125 [Ganoderma adspersum]